MKQILIVGGILDDPVGAEIVHNYVEGVRRVLGPDYTVMFTRITNLQLVITTGDIQIYDEGNNVQLRDVDLLVLHGFIRQYRDMAYALSHFAVMHDIPYFNDFSSYYSGTKIGQAVVFAQHGVRIPKTVFVMKDTDRFARTITKELGYPCIIKDASGTQGKSNYLVQSEDEVRRIFKAEPQITFVAQEYCPNDRDYRLLLTQSQQLVFERRGGEGTHINNTSQGGMAALSQDAIPADVVTQARAVAKSLGLTLAGVDLMPHLETGELYFIEINSQPQLFTGALTEAKEPLAKQLFLDALAQHDT